MDLSEYSLHALTDLWQDSAADAMEALSKLSAVRNEFLKRGFSRLASLNLVEASVKTWSCPE
jgi:DNA-binding IscR family transcriptional regulator